MTDCIAIIPARGGSKRIPRKNIRPLLGKPLIQWSIATAIQSGLFSEIMVSTDDDEIAETATLAGASVPFRRSEATSDDTATTTDVLKEVLSCYENSGRTFDSVCCLYPAAVLVSQNHLGEARCKLAADASLDAVMTVQHYKHPIERALRLQDGMVAFQNSNKQFSRTQDLTPSYHDAGQFYFFRQDSFKRTGKVIGDRCAAIVFETWDAVDLDDEKDWKFLELLMRLRKNDDR